MGTCAGAELRWNTFQHLHLNKKMSYGPPAPHQHRQHRATWKIIIINRLSAVTLPCPILSRLFMLHTQGEFLTTSDSKKCVIVYRKWLNSILHLLMGGWTLASSVPGKQRCRCDRIVPISHNPARLQMVASQPGDIGTNGPPSALTSRAHNEHSQSFHIHRKGPY